MLLKTDDDDSTLQDVEIEKQNQPQPKVKSKYHLLFNVLILFLISSFISFCIFHLAAEISAYFAYSLIFLVIGLICTMVSAFSENKKIQLLSKQALAVCWMTCVISILSFIRWYRVY